MGLNPQFLNSRVSDIRASDSKSSDSKVSETLDTWVSEASDSRTLEVSNRALGIGSFRLGSEAWSLEARGLRASQALTFLGFDLGLWVTGLQKGWFMTQQLSLNFLVRRTKEIPLFLKNGSNFQSPPQFRDMESSVGLVKSEAYRKSKFWLDKGRKVLNFESFLAGKFFEYSCPNFFETCGLLEA